MSETPKDKDNASIALPEAMRPNFSFLGINPLSHISSRRSHWIKRLERIKARLDALSAKSPREALFFQEGFAEVQAIINDDTALLSSSQTGTGFTPIVAPKWLREQIMELEQQIEIKEQELESTSKQ